MAAPWILIKVEYVPMSILQEYVSESVSEYPKPLVNRDRMILPTLPDPYLSNIDIYSDEQ